MPDPSNSPTPEQVYPGLTPLLGALREKYPDATDEELHMAGGKALGRVIQNFKASGSSDEEARAKAKEAVFGKQKPAGWDRAYQGFNALQQKVEPPLSAGYDALTKGLGAYLKFAGESGPGGAAGFYNPQGTPEAARENQASAESIPKLTAGAALASLVPGAGTAAAVHGMAAGGASAIPFLPAPSPAVKALDFPANSWEYAKQMSGLVPQSGQSLPSYLGQAASGPVGAMAGGAAFPALFEGRGAFRAPAQSAPWVPPEGPWGPHELQGPPVPPEWLQPEGPPAPEGPIWEPLTADERAVFSAPNEAWEAPFASTPLRDLSAGVLPRLAPDEIPTKVYGQSAESPMTVYQFPSKTAPQIGRIAPMADELSTEAQSPLPAGPAPVEAPVEIPTQVHPPLEAPSAPAPAPAEPLGPPTPQFTKSGHVKPTVEMVAAHQAAGGDARELFTSPFSEVKTEHLPKGASEPVKFSTHLDNWVRVNQPVIDALPPEHRVAFEAELAQKRLDAGVPLTAEHAASAEQAVNLATEDSRATLEEIAGPDLPKPAAQMSGLELDAEYNKRILDPSTPEDQRAAVIQKDRARRVAAQTAGKVADERAAQNLKTGLESFIADETGAIDLDKLGEGWQHVRDTHFPAPGQAKDFQLLLRFYKGIPSQAKRLFRWGGVLIDDHAKWFQGARGEIGSVVKQARRAANLGDWGPLEESPRIIADVKNVLHDRLLDILDDPATLQRYKNESWVTLDNKFGSKLEGRAAPASMQTLLRRLQAAEAETNVAAKIMGVVTRQIKAGLTIFRPASFVNQIKDSIPIHTITGTLPTPENWPIWDKAIEDTINEIFFKGAHSTGDYLAAEKAGFMEGYYQTEFAASVGDQLHAMRKKFASGAVDMRPESYAEGLFRIGQAIQRAAGTAFSVPDNISKYVLWLKATGRVLPKSGVGGVQVRPALGGESFWKPALLSAAERAPEILNDLDAAMHVNKFYMNAGNASEVLRFLRSNANPLSTLSPLITYAYKSPAIALNLFRYYPEKMALMMGLVGAGSAYSAHTFMKNKPNRDLFPNRLTVPVGKDTGIDIGNNLPGAPLLKLVGPAIETPNAPFIDKVGHGLMAYTADQFLGGEGSIWSPYNRRSADLQKTFMEKVGETAMSRVPGYSDWQRAKKYAAEPERPRGDVYSKFLLGTTIERALPGDITAKRKELKGNLMEIGSSKAAAKKAFMAVMKDPNASEADRAAAIKTYIEQTQRLRTLKTDRLTGGAR